MKIQLRKWRKQAKLSQSAAAELLGVPLKTFVKWEQGTHSPAGKHLATILKKLNLPIEPYVGKRIARWRLADRLTQRNAAPLLKISQSFLAKLEQDQQRCPAAVLKRLKALAPDKD